MNNSHMYDLDAAGAIDYPETENYSYDKWHCTPGLTDASEYKSVRFQMLQENLLLHWKYAYLEVQGRLVKKADGTHYATGANIAPIFNAIPHLFANAKFTIGTRCVENINHVGHVSSLMQYVLLPRSLSKEGGIQFMWVVDTDATATNANKGWEARRKYVIETPESKGKFKFRMPLNMIFGICDNFIALRGYPVDIELIRGPDYPALYRAEGTGEGKFAFTSMALNIPVITPSNAVNLKILQGIQHPKPYNFSFRCRNGLMAVVPKELRTYQLTITNDSFAERPQMIFVGFQTTKVKDQKFNYASYTHQDLETMVIRMNNCQIPSKPIASEFKENDNGFWFEQMLHLRANYLQFSGIYTENSFLNPDLFRSLYTVFCFDVSKQHDLVSSRTVSCELHATFRTEIQDDTHIYVAWYFDRTLELFTNGQAINIKSHTASAH